MGPDDAKTDRLDVNDQHKQSPGAFVELVRNTSVVSPEEKARAELVAKLEGDAPTLATLYGSEQLTRDNERELVSLARLPKWPGGPAVGHGWGTKLDEMLGGGVCPGYLLAVGAASAGAGKTAWVHQLADGLALRTAELLDQNQEGPLTPVLFLSEMRPDALTWRSLGRWTGRNASDFRAGGSHPEREAVMNAAHEALGGALGRSRAFVRYWQGEKRGRDLAGALANLLRTWTEQLQAEHPDREVWPVVVMDPLQRFRDHAGAGEVDAVNELVATIGAQARRDGWVVLLTSDTNKASATGATTEGRDKRNVLEEGAAALRGTYQLTHEADAVLYLRREDDRSGVVRAHVVKNRWGKLSEPDGKDSPAYTWEGAAMRFTAETVVPIASSTRNRR